MKRPDGTKDLTDVSNSEPSGLLYQFPLLTARIDEAAMLLGVMGNAQRLTVLKILSHGERSVRSINENVDVSQSALSQHLAVLRAADVVAVRRSGQKLYYSIKSASVLKILALLDLK